MGIYESGEDYLETIYLLSKKKSEVHAVDIANELNYSKPSITRALKILKENGFILVEPQTNGITLTEKGKKRAMEIYDKHRTITDFLTAIGVSEDTAAKDACRIEHDISEETFLSIKNWLDKK